MLTLREVRMLTRKTSRNHVTLTFILRPVTLSDAGSRLSAIRRKVAALGLEPSDIDKAIEWARIRRGRKR
jgi:hypothetical protein